MLQTLHLAEWRKTEGKKLQPDGLRRQGVGQEKPDTGPCAVRSCLRGCLQWEIHGQKPRHVTRAGEGVGEGDTRHPVDKRRWGDESGLELGGPRAAAQSRDTLKPRSRRPDRGGVCHARYPERNTPCSPTAPRACADCPAGLPGSPGGVARGAELTSVSGPLGRQGRTARGDRLRISAEVGALSPDAT